MKDKMEQLISLLLTQKWARLHGNLTGLKDGSYPGVYVLAYSDQDLEGKPINPRDIFYVGMSNSQGGVRQRLGQFLRAIEMGTGHSGGNRFYAEYAHDRPFSELENRKTFFVAVVTIPCDVDKKDRTPADLRAMGDVAALEYYVLAHIREALGREPELNKK